MRTQNLLAAMFALPLLMMGCSPSPSSTSAAGIPDKQCQFPMPLLGSSGQHAIYPVIDNLAIDTHRGSDAGDARGHVLNRLESAFAQRPGVLENRVKAYIQALKVGYFGLELPGFIHGARGRKVKFFSCSDDP